MPRNRCRYCGALMTPMHLHAPWLHQGYPHAYCLVCLYLWLHFWLKPGTRHIFDALLSRLQDRRLRTNRRINAKTTKS